MSDFLSDIRDWGVQTSQRLIENVLFGRKSAASPAPSAPGSEVSGSGLMKWAPFVLIAGVLVAALALFRKK